MSARPVRVLLTGAGGCVGRAIVAAAAREPGRWEIVGVYRSAPEEVPAGVTPLLSTLAELPRQLERAGEVDVCIHAAAAVHDAVRDPAGIFAVNRDQTLLLADALAGRPGFRRFVLVSTLAVLEQANEPSPTPYAASKREAEELAADRAAAGAFEAVSLRLATVYGPHDRGNIGSLFRAISKRRYVRIAPADTFKTLVSSRRAAAAALLAATADPLPGGGAWTVADPQPWPLGTVEDALADAAGVGRPPRIPSALGWAMAGVGSVMAAARLPAPLTLKRVRTMGRPVAFPPVPASGPVAEALAGADPRPLAEAFRDAYVRGVD